MAQAQTARTAAEIREAAQLALEQATAAARATMDEADDLEVAEIREAITECIDALEEIEVDLTVAEDEVARLKGLHAEKTGELDALNARLIVLRPEEAPPGAPAADESLEDANGSESKGHRVGRWCREFARGAFGK